MGGELCRSINSWHRLDKCNCWKRIHIEVEPSYTKWNWSSSKRSLFDATCNQKKRYELLDTKEKLHSYEITIGMRNILLESLILSKNSGILFEEVASVLMTVSFKFHIRSFQYIPNQLSIVSFLYHNILVA